MKSDPDWTSCAQEPLPEIINHVSQGTEVTACIHVRLGRAPFERKLGKLLVCICEKVFKGPVCKI